MRCSGAHRSDEDAWSHCRSDARRGVAIASGVCRPGKRPPDRRSHCSRAPALEQGLREGLKELGYIEGKNIGIEWRRYAPADEDLSLVATNLAQSAVGL